MAILNVTPDSFSDGGKFADPTIAVRRALALIDEGADIIDIGGESTRPGAEEISVKDEVARILPVIMGLRAETRELEQDITISIDTRKAEVAEAAIHAGADIWNDVSALSFNERSPVLAADLGCPIILMHAQGSPETMQDNPSYQDALGEVIDYLKSRIDVALDAGVDAKNILLDPGIGFGKRQEDNLALFKHLSRIKDLGFPVLMGASRKSFIGRIDGSTADDRLGGSLAAVLWSVSNGADILRVHDVPETVQAIKVWQAISGSD